MVEALEPFDFSMKLQFWSVLVLCLVTVTLLTWLVVFVLKTSKSGWIIG